MIPSIIDAKCKRRNVEIHISFSNMVVNMEQPVNPDLIKTRNYVQFLDKSDHLIYIMSLNRIGTYFLTETKLFK